MDFICISWIEHMWSQSGRIMGVTSECLILETILRYDKDIIVIVTKILRDGFETKQECLMVLF